MMAKSIGHEWLSTGVSILALAASSLSLLISYRTQQSNIEHLKIRAVQDDSCRIVTKEGLSPSRDYNEVSKSENAIANAPYSSGGLVFGGEIHFRKTVVKLKLCWKLSFENLGSQALTVVRLTTPSTTILQKLHGSSVDEEIFNYSGGKAEFPMPVEAGKAVVFQVREWVISSRDTETVIRKYLELDRGKNNFEEFSKTSASDGLRTNATLTVIRDAVVAATYKLDETQTGLFMLNFGLLPPKSVTLVTAETARGNFVQEQLLATDY